jgi:type IV secretory pathway VirB2 component (pilin)
MGKTAAGGLFAAAIIVVVVGADVLFFRNHFWERLAANVGIVLVFAAFYFRFFRQTGS